MGTVGEEALRLARIIWDYHQLGHQPIPADVIVALGTNDLRVAEFAADLYLRGFGATLVCTGGLAHQDDLLATPTMTLDEYFTAELSPEQIINILMGDLQRIWVYARRGWSAPQRIPAEVREAYGELVALGFTKHLIAE